MFIILVVESVYYVEAEVDYDKAFEFATKAASAEDGENTILLCIKICCLIFVMS